MTKLRNLNTLSVSVVGASGYTGLELVRTLLQHPFVKLDTLYIRDETQTETLANLLSIHIPGSTYSISPSPSNHEVTWGYFSRSRVFRIQSLKSLVGSAPVPGGLVFLATPAEDSIYLASQFLELGQSVIDLSGAFRLSESEFETWYGFTHSQPKLITRAHYGLQPFASNKLPQLSAGPVLIANPGCYATAAALSVIPVLQDNSLCDLDFVVMDAKSGTTGAGKKPRESLLLSEAGNDYVPYKIGNHQHEPEILKTLDGFTRSKLNLCFNTSLLPIARGISVSTYLKLMRPSNTKEVLDLYKTAFQDYPLIQLFDLTDPRSEGYLKLNRVVGTAFARIGVHASRNQLRIVTVIDNLMKGAASQAIENLNALLGLPLDTGLSGQEFLNECEGGIHS